MMARLDRDVATQRHSPHAFAKAAFIAAQAKIAKRQAHTLIAADDEITAAVLQQRAPAPAGSTTGSGFASQIALTAYRGFLGSLTPYSGAARLIARAIPAELSANVAAKYPCRPAGPATPAWVKELDPIPVRQVAVDVVAIGPKRKIASIIPWTRELSKRSDALAIFTQMLREDASRGLDAAFFSSDVGSDAAHEGLLYNLTALTPANFTGTEGIRSVLGDLAAAVSESGSGDTLFVAPPDLVARLRIEAPELAAVDIAPSGAVPAGRIICVDPQSVLVSVGDFPEIDASEHATVHMNTEPLEIVSATGPTGADPVRSFWQTASVMLRVIAEMAWARRRTGAVAFADNVQWW